MTRARHDTTPSARHVQLALELFDMGYTLDEAAAHLQTYYGLSRDAADHVIRAAYEVDRDPLPAAAEELREIMGRWGIRHR